MPWISRARQTKNNHVSTRTNFRSLCIYMISMGLRVYCTLTGFFSFGIFTEMDIPVSPTEEGSSGGSSVQSPSSVANSGGKGSSASLSRKSSASSVRFKIEIQYQHFFFRGVPFPLVFCVLYCTWSTDERVVRWGPVPMEQCLGLYCSVLYNLFLAGEYVDPEWIRIFQEL